MKFPNGRRFAFSILDDTDDATLEGVAPVYDFGVMEAVDASGEAPYYTRAYIEGQPLDIAADVPVPDKRDLDLGNQLAFDFAGQFLPQHYDDIRDMFRRRGAYGRFKDFLEQKDMLEKWYVFSDQQEKKALGEWCETKGVSLGS